MTIWLASIRHSLMLLMLLVLPLASPAASRKDYLVATLSGWSNNPSLNRSVKATGNILFGTNVVGFGRGEIIIVRPLLLVWRETGDEKCLKQAQDIVLACNKVMLDGFDAPQLNNASQVAFALPELAAAYATFKNSGKLPTSDVERMAAMLKAATDFWLRTRPQPSSGNLDQRYALGVAVVANIFPNDVRAVRWRAWATIPFEQIIHYPFGERPFAGGAPDNGEQSNLYEAATLLGWISLGEALGRGAEMRTPVVRAWIDRYYQQLLPSGIMPAYGDGCWADSWPQWIGAFEWAAAAFQSPAYRAAADGIFRYAQKAGLASGDYTEAMAFADEQLKPCFEPRGSLVTARQDSAGARVPDKLILRGKGDAASQPYVFVHASEGVSHSHQHTGALGAYAVGGEVFLHEFGYDATAAAFHNLFLIRPVDAPFLNFAGNPKETLLAKIDAAGRRLTSLMPSDNRHVREAVVHDQGAVVYGRVVMDCVTQDGGRDFRGKQFSLVRELVLSKQTGVLCVRDTLESRQNISLACGPVWHVQNILATNANGFLCQDLYQSRIGTDPNALIVGGPSRPVWVMLTGPPGMSLGDKFWHFSVRSGRVDEPQENHLTSEWRGNLAAGQKLSFVTVFTPQPMGTTVPPTNVEVRVDGDQAMVHALDLDFNFAGHFPTPQTLIKKSL